jgi:UDP-2,4-diacetamido-2,4,6-trideoxy-beta-L-altropyranose hydrolase
MNVAFRVDASSEIGSGHFMRVLCLADGLRELATSIRFVARALPAHLRAMLAERGYDLTEIGAAAGGDDDARETATALAGDAWDWLVVDHYGIGADWESKMRAHAKRIFVVDDLADRRHDCDVLLDQNLYADMDVRYTARVPRGCRLLLGLRYALLRREFVAARADVLPRRGPVTRVFVSFGGADPGNRTGWAIEALATAAIDVQVDVAIGAQHPQRRQIESGCARHGFACHVQTGRMAELMVAADLAIGAGGITTWERCCLGLPALVISIAANQDAVIEQAARHGLLYALHDGDQSDLRRHLQTLADNAELREMISRNGMQAVDGRGVERVARVLDEASIRIREATADDAEALFAWRNHESVRRMSRRPEAIAWPEHEAWLRGVLADGNRRLVIAERRGVPLGVVRFDICRDTAEVSIYRVPDSPERGVGASVLAAAEQWLRASRPGVATVTAEVLGNNQRSQRLFESTGYELHAAKYTKRLSD